LERKKELQASPFIRFNRPLIDGFESGKRAFRAASISQRSDNPGMKEYICLGVALILNAAANILVKMAAVRSSDSDDGVAGAMAVYLSPLFIGGLVCFCLNLLSYTLALQKIPLVVAYPIMVGTGYVIMVIVSRYCLNETLSWIQIAGAMLILAGLVLILPRS